MKAKYLTPRLAVTCLESHQDSQRVKDQAKSRHGPYVHFFNLTLFKLGGENESEFKWRGTPFSASEGVKIMTQIDVFLRINIANAAIICTSGLDMEQYGLFLGKTYLLLCAQSTPEGAATQTVSKLQILAQKTTKNQPYLTR
jgi:hypothetical protein